MNIFSAYVFRQTALPLLAILASLGAIGVLTQGLNQLDVVIANRDATFALLWMTLLTLPQNLSIILPFAVLISVVYALNRMRQESELAVAFSAGVSASRTAAPIVQLACLVALAHLAINTVVQPLAFREIRHTLNAVRSEMATGMVREGLFNSPSPGLTIYARALGPGGVMRDLFIDDERRADEITYTARYGYVLSDDRQQTLVLVDGQVQRPERDGALDVVAFDRYVVRTGARFHEPEAFYLKPSDRFLYELLFPDLTQSYDYRNARQLWAEGHSRLSSPLLDIALALVAVAGVLGGSYSRQGSPRRLVATVALGMIVRLAAMGLQVASVADPRVNAIQYALPISVMLVASLLIGGDGKRRRRSMYALAAQPEPWSEMGPRPIAGG